jgi:Cd2+/Zn2+-exporting ATPase
LTVGRPHVTGVTSFGGHTDPEVIAAAASVERDSEHPLAASILQAAAGLDGKILPTQGFEALPGLGVRAWIDGVPHAAGNTRLMERTLGTIPEEVLREVATREAAGETAVIVARDDQIVGVIGIADMPRPGSREAVADLRQAGVEHVVMLTGDNQRTAAAVAAELGLDDYRAELLPEDKVEAVRELTSVYGSVAMVGDGINDAPALATADVGIAMGAAGTDTALETADIALMADDLSRVPFAIRLSRAARATVRQNITFALGLKLATLLLVFPGWLTLWMAVLADTGGSLIVIANGLRLLRHEKDATQSAVGLPAVRRSEPAHVAACASDGCACSLSDSAHTDHRHREFVPEVRKG